MSIVATVARIYECDDELMYKNKPARKPGQALDTVPLRTIPEAAQYLAIDAWTLLDWYSKRDAILKPSGWYGEAQAFALLSFRDIEEAYKVHLLRTKFHYSMQYIRKALVHARLESKSDHPLIDEKMLAFDCLALYMRGRGRRTSHVIALGEQRPLYIPEVVDTWGKRIIADSKGRTKQIFPWRFAANDDVSRPVSLEPDVLSGTLVVTGTRIPVKVLQGRNQAGESPEHLAKDYGVDLEIVKQALAHFDQKTPRTVRSVS
jgi:uncharacterized protein (DUF433 family)